MLGHNCLRRGWAIAVLVATSLPNPVRSADQADLRQWAQLVGTIELSLADGQTRRASAVIVDGRGILATSFQALRGATKARVTFHNGTAVDVIGWVAARRSLDLVLMAVRVDQQDLPAARLIDRDVKLGEPVHGIGGPGSVPLLAASDKLVRVESGQRYRRSRPASDTQAVDNDQCRLLTHAFLTPASSGGALFADDGQLVGILIPSADWKDRIHVAVHAGHIAWLLDNRHDSRPLATLKSVTDSDSTDASLDAGAAVGTEAAPHFSSATKDNDTRQRGGSLRMQLRSLRDMLAALPVERRTLAEQAEDWKKDARAPQQAFEALQQQAAANRLRFASIVPEIVTTTPTSPVRPGAGGTQSVAIERRFSPRQLAARAQLNTEFLNISLQLTAADAERLRQQSRLQQIEYDQAAIGRYQTQLLRQLFYLADPLEMRSEADVEDGLAELNDEIDQGGADPQFLLARGLIRTRLGRWDEALADLDMAHEDDRALQPLVELVRARIALLRGESGGREQVQRGGRGAKDDPRMSVLLARCALDQRDGAAAARALRAALEAGGDVIEIQRGLAQVYLLGTAGARNVKRAQESAQAACQATHGTDWHSLAVLSLTQAAAGSWDHALVTLDRAENLSEEYGQDVCRTWQAILRRHELPPDLWGHRAPRS